MEQDVHGAGAESAGASVPTTDHDNAGDGDAITTPAAGSVNTTAAPSTPAAVSSSYTAPPSSSSSTSTAAIGMFFGMDSVSGGDGDDAINIIEDGDHVSADDFGLSSAEISASAAEMGHMGHMAMELNALQIQAFLARAERDANSALLPAASVRALQSSASVAQADAARVCERAEPSPTELTTVAPQSTASNTARSGLLPAAPTNAYDASRSVVFYSRREDKMRALHAHPVVAAVAPDGRAVTCKCGRVVRLNPPWYILKFEQHIVSRNCSFLRATAAQRSTSRTTVLSSNDPAAETSAAPAEATATVTPTAAAVDTDTASATDCVMQNASDMEQQPAVTMSNQLEHAAAVATRRSVGDSGSRRSSLPSSTEAQQTRHTSDVSTELPATAASAETSTTDSYALLALHEALAGVFAFASDGTIDSPPPPLVDSSDSSTDALAALRRLQYDAAVVLQAHAHFSRVTPDGRFVECTCDKLVALAAPWTLDRFYAHVASKQAPTKPKKRRASALQQTQTTVSGRSSSSNNSCSAAAARLQRKSFPTAVHWDAALARNLLPCPGLRDDKMSALVAAAVHLTGGARPRHKIAQQLFPDQCAASTKAPPAAACRADPTATVLTADAAADSVAAAPSVLAAAVDSVATETPVNTADPSPSPTSTPPVKVAYNLSPEQKLLLHDAIEAEALWFIDKDGASVRSLECAGLVDATTTRDGAAACARCMALQSNVSLRTAAACTAKRAQTLRNPLHRKFRASRRACEALDAAFDMDEAYARILRDLALLDLPSDSALNVWLDAAEMGLAGAFDRHAALLGLVEHMVARKDKERRGVGKQNMSYSDALDTFMRSLAAVSMDACALFQQHLGGRSLHTLAIGHKRKRAVVEVSVGGRDSDTAAAAAAATDSDSGGTMRQHAVDDASSATDGFAGLLDATSASLMPSLSIHDMNDVDLSAFTAATQADDSGQRDDDALAVNTNLPALQSERGVTDDCASANHENVASAAAESMPPSELEPKHAAEAATTSSSSATVTVVELRATATDDTENNNVNNVDNIDTSPKSAQPAKNPSVADTALVPCTGLRGDRVQQFVKTAVQPIGGSRPKYVIAKELFPHVFAHEKAVKIGARLSTAQQQMLQDAVYSECLWRIDKVGMCVRSLRCHRFVDPRTTVCRACRDLKAVPNFRSVLSRAKVPKVLANVKYVPTSLTTRDPLLGKLAKNASFRALYARVQCCVSTSSPTSANRKRAVLWLKCARMGVCGRFQSHPVFAGLVASMVEVKDKERRGVGKQNMQYAPALDDFLHALAAQSMAAFDIFAAHFCGRTLRSQQVKKRRMVASGASATAAEVEASTLDALHAALPNNILDAPGQQHTGHSEHSGQHDQLLAPDELLGGRQLSASDMEENQRFMDHMLAEVRLSVGHDDLQLHHHHHHHHHDGHHLRGSDAGNSDTGAPLEPRTYLDDQGVLTTEI